MLNLIKKIIRRKNMTTKAKGTKFFKEGTQNQQILENYWGNGKSFTTEDLTDNLDIMSPGARLTELRDAGFDIRVVETNSHDSVGRPEATYKIMQRRAFA
jgi:response regulator of citrate/malate metabolism|tara:strand:- start:881 stop:1180 length:300 start_codon:yes stop_codon:yes gene_type:complete